MSWPLPKLAMFPPTRSGSFACYYHPCSGSFAWSAIPAQAPLPGPSYLLGSFAPYYRPCSGSFACYNPAQARLPVTISTLKRLVCPSIIPAQARLPDLLRLVCQLLTSLLRLAFLVYHTCSRSLAWNKQSRQLRFSASYYLTISLLPLSSAGLLARRPAT